MNPADEIVRLRDWIATREEWVIEQHELAYAAFVSGNPPAPASYRMVRVCEQLSAARKALVELTVVSVVAKSNRTYEEQNSRSKRRATGG